MGRIINAIEGRPHHYRVIEDDGTESTLIAREGLTPEEILREISEITPPSYVELRQGEYPPIAEQLDMIYHNITAWRAVISEIKKKYPK